MSESTDSFKTLNHSVTKHRRVLRGERADSFLELFLLVKQNKTVGLSLKILNIRRI